MHEIKKTLFYKYDKGKNRKYFHQKKTPIVFIGVMTRRTYLLDRKTQTKSRLNGVLPSTRLPQKAKLQQHFASHMLFSTPQLPPKVDLRPEMTLVEDQSSVGSWQVS